MAKASSRKVILAAFLGTSLIAAMKFAAAAFTGSSAMLSEAIHSVVDTGNQLLLFHGMRRGGRPADTVEAAVSDLERRSKGAVPEITRIFIEAQSWSGHRENLAALPQ